jgi:hypothetical protein
LDSAFSFGNLLVFFIWTCDVAKSFTVIYHFNT